MFLKEIYHYQENGGKKGISKELKDSLIRDPNVDINNNSIDSIVAKSFYSENGELYYIKNNKLVISNEEIFDLIQEKHNSFGVSPYKIKDYLKKTYYNVTGPIHDIWLNYCDHCYPKKSRI